MKLLKLFVVAALWLGLVPLLHAAPAISSQIGYLSGVSTTAGTTTVYHAVGHNVGVYSSGNALVVPSLLGLALGLPVTYDANEATGGDAPDTQTKFYDLPLTLAANSGNLVRIGYTFDRWNSQADGMGTNYAQGASYTANVAVTLFAKWTINQYTITFNSDGGSSVDPITQDFNTAVTAPANPIREGHAFIGWDPVLPVTMPASNETHTAKWAIVIETAEQLDELRNHPGAQFKLTEDIDLSGVDWVPIGTAEQPFTGSLTSSEDGVVRNITGLGGKPLFDVIGPGAEVADLNIQGSVNNDAGDNAGLLANEINGSAEAPAIIRNITIDDQSAISGGSFIGGLAGTINHAKIDSVTIDANVSGSGNSVGGVGGQINDSELRDITVNGGVQGIGSNVGGVGGQINRSANASCVLEQIRINGNVSGGNKTGGVGGSIDGCTVSDVEVTGTVTGADDTGGVGGTINDAEIRDVLIDADVSGDDRVGGIGGSIVNSTIDNVTVNGDVSGDADFGAIGGQTTNSTVTNDTSTGQVFDKPSGSGSTAEPYEITTAEQIGLMRVYPDAHYRLNNDLDLTGIDWRPIGTETEPFTGSLKSSEPGVARSIRGLGGKPLFDVIGPGAVVSDLTIVGSMNAGAEANSGLLANRIVGTEDKPVVIDNITIDSTSRIDGGSNDNIGGLAGTITHAELSNITIEADVSGRDNVGGVAGQISDSKLNDTKVNGAVTGRDNVGGVGGQIRDSELNATTVNGNVTGNDHVGGVGGSIDGGTIDTVTVNGDVFGQSNVGPIGGQIRESEVSNGIVPGLVSQTPTSGDGSAENPYVIETAEQLAWIHNEPDAHYLLTSDLDLSGVVWQPLGSEDAPFTGSLTSDEGKPVTITGLDGKPLFDVVGPGAVVKDLIIVGSVNTDAEANSGLLANRIEGTEQDPVVIENITIDSTSSINGGANDTIGGLAGTITHTELSNITIDADVSGNDNAGGVGGQISDSKISDTTVNGDVTGNVNVGGIGGSIQNSTLERVEVNGDTEGNSNVGGVGGTMNDVVITDITINGEVNGTDEATTGLIHGAGDGNDVGLQVSATTGTGGSVAPAYHVGISEKATVSFAVSANSGYSLNTAVGGTCPTGSWVGNTWTTGEITENCSASFSFNVVYGETVTCDYAIAGGCSEQTNEDGSTTVSYQSTEGDSTVEVTVTSNSSDPTAPVTHTLTTTDGEGRTVITRATITLPGAISRIGQDSDGNLQVISRAEKDGVRYEVIAKADGSAEHKVRIADGTETVAISTVPGAFTEIKEKNGRVEVETYVELEKVLFDGVFHVTRAVVISRDDGEGYTRFDIWDEQSGTWQGLSRTTKDDFEAGHTVVVELDEQGDLQLRIRTKLTRELEF